MSEYFSTKTYVCPYCYDSNEGDYPNCKLIKPDGGMISDTTYDPV
jgi:hypothetical protein